MIKVQWRSGRWQIPFFSIWIGQAFSLLGSSLVGFALIWWLTAETRSATILALATLMQMLPQVLLGPLAGTLVDRWSRRAVMLVADSLVALVTLWLAYLFLSGTVQVWHVYVALFVRAGGGVFHWPAMQASTSLMVPERHLARVAGLNQTLQGLQSVIGPPLGALLLSLLPIQGILFIDMGTALLAVLPLLFIAIPEPERKAATDAQGQVLKPSVWREMREGFHYVWAWPGLMAVIGMAMLLNFIINPAFSLLPILVTDHFGGAAVELGWLESAWGIGMLVGGLVLGVWGGFKRRMVTSLVGISGMGAGILLLGLSPAAAFGLGLAGLCLAGFMNPIANGPLMALMQASVAPEMQGRVFSLLGAAAQAVAPLGLLIIGPLADVVGVRVPLIAAGGITLLMGVGAFFIPAIMTIEANRQGAGAAETPAAQTAAAVE